ncbi:hypothetical protein, partial [Caenimonas sedimenti]|uniref:hypothetical protein n=1 Tax=Caenimonas sedimenti TaxID=2596921 RepID=UPI0016446181
DQVVRAMSIAMGVTAWLVIMPLSLATLATGLTQALGTAWGLLRHYWVLFKLLLTAVATVVLLLKLGPISVLAGAAGSATFSGSDLLGLRTSLTLHAAAGLVVLLAAVGLAIYKPAGLVRKVPLGSGTAYAIPLWVKVVGACIGVLMLMVVIMMLLGGHGPNAHLP